MAVRNSIILGCSALARDGFALVSLKGGRVVRLREEHAHRLQRDYPKGQLFGGGNGKGRFYVRLKPRERGAAQNLMVSRIIVAWELGGDLAQRVVHYADGDPFNLDPANLTLSPPGPYRASDRTFQDNACREWKLSHPKKRNKDGEGEQ